MFLCIEKYVLMGLSKPRLFFSPYFFSEISLVFKQTPPTSFFLSKKTIIKTSQFHYKKILYFFSCKMLPTWTLLSNSIFTKEKVANYRLLGLLGLLLFVWFKDNTGILKMQIKILIFVLIFFYDYYKKNLWFFYMLFEVDGIIFEVL